METFERKLIDFERIVLNEANKQKNSIIEEIEKYKADKISEIENNLLEGAYKRIQKEIALIVKTENEKVGKITSDCKKKLLSRREEIIDEIFKNLLDKVYEHKKTDDYYMWLESSVRAALKAVKDENADIFIDKSDERFKERLEKLVGREISFSAADITGGCKAASRKNKIVADNTILSRLDTLKTEFMEEMAQFRI